MCIRDRYTTSSNPGSLLYEQQLEETIFADISDCVDPITMDELLADTAVKIEKHRAVMG